MEPGAPRRSPRWRQRERLVARSRSASTCCARLARRPPRLQAAQPSSNAAGRRTSPAGHQSRRSSGWPPPVAAPSSSSRDRARLVTREPAATRRIGPASAANPASRSWPSSTAGLRGRPSRPAPARGPWHRLALPGLTRSPSSAGRNLPGRGGGVAGRLVGFVPLRRGCPSWQGGARGVQVGQATLRRAHRHRRPRRPVAPVRAGGVPSQPGRGPTRFTALPFGSSARPALFLVSCRLLDFAVCSTCARARRARTTLVGADSHVPHRRGWRTGRRCTAITARRPGPRPRPASADGAVRGSLLAHITTTARRRVLSAGGLVAARPGAYLAGTSLRLGGGESRRAHRHLAELGWRTCARSPTCPRGCGPPPARLPGPAHRARRRGSASSPTTARTSAARCTRGGSTSDATAPPAWSARGTARPSG